MHLGEYERRWQTRGIEERKSREVNRMQRSKRSGGRLEPFDVTAKVLRWCVRGSYGRDDLLDRAMGGISPSA